jgi:hypothetical protein
VQALINFLARFADLINGFFKVTVAESKTNQIQIMTNQVIAAGASYYTAYEKLDGVTSLYMTVKAEASHSYRVRAIQSPDGVGDVNWMADAAVTSNTSATSINVPSDYMKYGILNNDASSHTYNAWRRYRVI